MSIPSYLGSTCFWEYDTETIDPIDHQKFVIGRILEFGDDEAIRWVLATFSEGAIADTIRTSRIIGMKTALFWANVLGVPKEKVLCITIGSRSDAIPLWKN